MMDAIRNAAMRLWKPSVEGRHRRFVASVLVSATAVGSVPVIAALQSEAVSDVRGAPGSFWLSGEEKAQVVLAATGGELASLALTMPSELPVEFDVVDTGSQVLVHNRTNGGLIQVDGIEGRVGQDWDAPAVTGDGFEPRLIPAGDVVYLVDPLGGVVRPFTADEEGKDSTPGAEVSVGPFDQWVGVDDGSLWVLDTPTGELRSIDGQRVTRIDFSEPALDLELSVIGNSPVVLDRSGGRLRWPRAADSVAVPGFTGEALLQRPTAGGDCIVVIVPGAAHCFADGVEVRQMAVTIPIPDLRAAQLFANEDNLLVVYPDRPDVVVGEWGRGTWSALTREEPSGRSMIGHFTPGALLVDDPGSRFALTADRGELIALDKFNQRTVLLSADGVATGAGAAAAPGGEDGGDDGSGGEGEVVGEGQVFDDASGPDPRDDEAVTRVQRTKQIDVLANDRPVNAALAVKSVTVDSGAGTADVIDGSSVLFRPDGNLPGQAQLTYVVNDADGRTGSAKVNIEIVGPDQNTAPLVVDDSVSVESGVDIAIDVLANDADAEGDTLSITKVVKPKFGTASVNESGQISYQSEPGYVGSDSFNYEVKDGYGGESTATVNITVAASSAANRQPSPAPDRAILSAGTSIQVDVLANDTDPDGDGLRVVDVEVPESSGLTASVLPSQQVALSAATNAPAALVQVIYSIADTAIPPHRVQSTIAVVVTANPEENRPPIAVDDTAVVSQTSSKVVNLTSNDSDPDGDPLTITSLLLAGLDSSLGTVRQISPSSIEFTPANGAVAGTTTFSYVVSDNNRASDTAVVTIQLVPTSNSGPVARDDIVTVFGGDPVTIAVLGNDSHPDGLPLALSGQPSFSTGVIRVNPDDSITFTPPSADPRTYTFSYTVKDPNGRTATAQVVITVDRAATKSVPVAADDQASTAFNTSKTIDVLANDADPDGQAIEIASIGTVSDGSAVITGRTVRYTPPINWNGLATFVYTIRDADGGTASATVVVQVLAPIKEAPTARDDLASIETRAITTVDVLANDTDPDGPAAALTLGPLGAVPAGITATVVANKIRVTASAAEGTFVIPYTAIDADGLTSSGKLTVLVNAPANQPPVPVNDSATTEFGVGITIPVIGNDTDPEGGLLTLGSVTTPLDETGAVAGSARASGNSVRYEPGSFAGGVVTFQYVVSDERNRTAVGQVRVVVAQCVAPPLTPTNDTVSVGRGRTTTFNPLANDGSTVGELTLGEPSGGRVTKLSNTSVQYEAPAAAGSYSFTYTVTNGCGARASASVAVQVNRAPTAVNDTPTVEVDGPVATLNVLTNDTDPDEDTLTIIRVTPDTAASITGNGRTLSFRPPSTSGPVSFTYTVADCTATGCNPANSTATVTVNVIQPNRPPVANADSRSMAAGESSLLIDVLANDTDPDNNTLILTNAFVMVSPANGGTITNEAGKARFTPSSPCSTGVYTFTYWVTDGTGAGATGTVTVTINAAVNEAPVAGDDGGYTVDATGTLTISLSQLLSNDTDPNICDRPGLTITAVNSGSGGDAVLSGATVVFTPTPGSPGGSGSFTYTVSDGARTATGNVSITVTPPPTTTTPTTTPPPTVVPPP